MAIKLKKFVYLGHPRSASQATSLALEGLGGVRVAPNHELPKQFGTEETVCTLRNPLDLLTTWFHLSGWDDFAKFIREYSHDKFIQDGRLYYLAGWCDTFLRYDRLQSDFNILLERHGLPATRIYRINTTSNKRPWQTYYNIVTKNLALQKFEQDVALYEAMDVSCH